jgi:hypothetical protein
MYIHRMQIESMGNQTYLAAYLGLHEGAQSTPFNINACRCSCEGVAGVRNFPYYVSERLPPNRYFIVGDPCKGPHDIYYASFYPVLSTSGDRGYMFATADVTKGTDGGWQISWRYMDPYEDMSCNCFGMPQLDDVGN